MAFETVKYSFGSNIAVITLNRPEAMNALSLQLCIDLHSAVEKAIGDRARAIVLTGEGRAFCSGGDLREMRSMWEKEGRIEAFMQEPLKALHGLIALIRHTPIPFVAAVGGICAGAGTNFALACDIVVASENAAFNEAFVKIGLSPDCGGTYFLPRAIGEKRAAQMLMLGETLTAAEAFSIGLINAVVPAGEHLNEAMKIAAKLADGPTEAIGRIKKMLNASFGNTLEKQLELEHECQIESGRSADFKEGVNAFFEKRPPKFNS